LRRTDRGYVAARARPDDYAVVGALWHVAGAYRPGYLGIWIRLRTLTSL
jgi:hypothetical protein